MQHRRLSVREALEALGLPDTTPVADALEVCRTRRAAAGVTADGEAADDLRMLNKAEFWLLEHQRASARYRVSVEVYDPSGAVRYAPADASSGAPGHPVLVVAPGWSTEDRRTTSGTAQAVLLRRALESAGRAFLPALVVPPHDEVCAAVALSGLPLPDDLPAGSLIVRIDASGMTVQPPGAGEALRLHVRVSQSAHATDPLPRWVAEQEAAEAAQTRARELAEKEQQRKREHAAERRRVASERRAEAARQLDEARQRLLEEGWPAGWEPSHAEGWRSSGGGVAEARAVSAAGWSPAEAVEAAPSRAGQTLPEGDAALHRAHGDCLHGLWLGSWPAVPAGTVVSVCRQQRDGRASRAALVRDDGRHVLQVARRVRGTWSWSEATPCDDPWRALRPWLTLSTGSCRWITTGPGGPTTDEVLRHLVVPFEGGRSEDPDTWSSDDDAAATAALWAAEDEVLQEELPLQEETVRWAEVDGARVALARTAPRRLVPFLVQAGEVRKREVASASWSSESGGAPISWDGGGSVSWIADSLLLEQTWGDVEPGTHIAACSPSPSALARYLSDWVRRHEHDVPAALALEPSHAHLLGPSAQEEWHRLLSGLTADVAFSVDDVTTAALRRHLARHSSRYRYVRQALRDPRSGPGRHLLDALRDADTDGVLGPVLSLQPDGGPQANRTPSADEAFEPDGFTRDSLSRYRAAGLTRDDLAGWSDESLEALWSAASYQDLPIDALATWMRRWPGDPDAVREHWRAEARDEG